MPVERRQQLEALPDWSWDFLADRWEEGFSHLKQFVEREGHCRVPSAYKADDGYKLGRWIWYQRLRRDKINSERRQRLEALLGWSWGVLAYRWEEGFSHLKQFADREGSLPCV